MVINKVNRSASLRRLDDSTPVLVLVMNVEMRGKSVRQVGVIPSHRSPGLRITSREARSTIIVKENELMKQGHDIRYKYEMYVIVYNGYHCGKS